MTRTHVTPSLSQNYLAPLLTGDRAACRQVVEGALAAGATAYDLLTNLIWPTMERIQQLFKDDQITKSAVNLSTRLNRSITDQLTTRLPKAPAKNKKVLLFCGNDEPEELGGQICADLFESDGWTVKFAGGGVPEDEVLSMIGHERPDVLVMFGTLPAGVPGVRKLIDYLRDVNSCPDMQVLCCGGIYKRAEGLAEEIGADLFAAEAQDAVRVANEHPTKRATVDQQTVGRMRRIRKAQLRRVSPTEVHAG